MATDDQSNPLPIKITPEERQYYRDVWGFDPDSDKIVADPVENPGVAYYYESEIDLVNDPALAAANLQVFARVVVDQQNRSHNILIFMREDREASIDCLHTAVYLGSPEEINKMTNMELNELSQVLDGKPVELPPWAHFVALKSFAQGLSDIGFLQLCIPPKSKTLPEREEDFIFESGINYELKDQIISELWGLVPEIVKNSLYELASDLLDRASTEWLLHRLEFLEEKFGIHSIFLDPAFIASLNVAAVVKLLKTYLQFQYHHVSRIVEDKFRISSFPLSPDLIEILTIPDKRSILLMLVEEIQWGQEDDFIKIAAKLFQDFIFSGDSEIIKNHNLELILEAIVDPFELGPPGNTSEDLVEKFQDIAAETLRQLFDSIFRIWHDNPEEEDSWSPTLGDFPFQLIFYLLKTSPSQAEYQKLLKRVIEKAPQWWLEKNLQYLEVEGQTGQNLNLEQENNVQIPDSLERRFDSMPLKQIPSPELLREKEILLRSALNNNSKDPEIWYSLGINLRNQGRREDCIKAIRTALKYKPNHSLALVELAILQTDNGDYDQAKITSEKALEISPNSARAWQILGKVLEQIGDLERAELAFLNAVECDSKDPSSWIKLIEFYVNVDRIRKAKATLRHAQEQDHRFMGYRIRRPNHDEKEDDIDIDEDSEDEDEE